MALPQLAIVVPTRNSSVLLPRLVRSLQDQTLIEFRVIFVDASTALGEREYLEQLVRSDRRFSWVPQDAVSSGIYGAMNIGFSCLTPSEWALFWGSDDWASTPVSLYEAISHPCLREADLVVCRGRYIRHETNGDSRIVRYTSFNRLVNYRLSMFLGCAPPHQCTIIGPGARRLRDRYDDRFSIASDLDYFLSLSRYGCCNVRIIPVSLVDIAVGGISGLEHRRRFREVLRAYRNAFRFLWIVPFILRYFQRFFALCRLY